MPVCSRVAHGTVARRRSIIIILGCSTIAANSSSCCHSMPCRVYVTARCLSVCLSVPSFDRRTPLQRVCCCGLGGQETSIRCCTTGAEHHGAQHSGQCRVVSQRVKLKTDLGVYMATNRKLRADKILRDNAVAVVTSFA